MAAAAAAAALTALGLEVSAVTAHVHQLLRGVREAPSSQGLSFLHLKNQQLAMYLSDLTHLILGKVTAGSICDHPARLRLVELRTVLEKMRPIEHKLRYQIDKLVKTAITGTLGEEHPLAFKPNPGNLISKLEEEEDEEEDGEDPGEKRPLKQSSRPPRNVYIPPRLIPMHYGGEESVGERSRRAGERMRRRALGSSLVRELHEEFSEAPREETQRNDVHGGGKLEKQRAHRVQYEESMMVRLSVPRGERRSRGSHSLAMTSQLRSLTHFSSITALTGDMDPAPVQKKRKVTAQTKRRKGFRRH